MAEFKLMTLNVGSAAIMPAKVSGEIKWSSTNRCDDIKQWSDQYFKCPSFCDSEIPASKTYFSTQVIRRTPGLLAWSKRSMHAGSSQSSAHRSFIHSPSARSIH